MHQADVPATPQDENLRGSACTEAVLTNFWPRLEATRLLTATLQVVQLLDVTHDELCKHGPDPRKGSMAACASASLHVRLR